VGGGACNASSCPKIPFHHVTGIFFMSSRWSDACWLWWFDLFLVNLYFFFLFFSLSSLEKYSLILFVVGISTSILILFIFNFYSWSFYRNFICFQFRLSIPSHILLFFFQVGPYSFDFFNFFSWSFCKSFIGFQFYH
jgi:hypothetical protein